MVQSAGVSFICWGRVGRGRGYVRFRGGSRIFFRRGCTSLLLYFNTNKPHSFFLQKTSCIRKPQVISDGGGGGGGGPRPPPPPPPPCTLPLDPPLRLLRVSQEVYKLSLQMASAMKQFGFNFWKSLICKDFQDYVHIIPWNYVQLNLAYGYLVWRPSSKFIYQLF